MVHASILYTTFLAAAFAVGNPIVPRAVDKPGDDKQKLSYGGDAGRDAASSNFGNASKTPHMPSSSAVMGLSSTMMTPQPMMTSAPFGVQAIASEDEDLECTVNLVTVVSTVTVTMAPPEGMGYATDIRYSTIYPTETSSAGNKVVNNNNNNGDAMTTATRYANGQHMANPTDAVPVSRAGTKLNPTAAAEANQFDDTARRALESVNVRAADGRCLVIDPTAGDFRQNLIPVGLAECSEAPEQKFDVVTQGKHNDAKDGKALLVSVLTNGCLSFDNRRQPGDTVTIFSCGGRADGEGQTSADQLFPFDGTDNIVLQPSSDSGKFCLVAGKDRLDSTSCDNQKDQVFELVEVLQSTADTL